MEEKDSLKCNECNSTNVYTTQSEIVCRKCGERRMREK